MDTPHWTEFEDDEPRNRRWLIAVFAAAVVMWGVIGWFARWLLQVCS